MNFESKIIKSRKLFFIFGIIVPWILVLLYGYFRLETYNSFFENNETMIKILLLLVVIYSCCWVIYKEIKENRVRKLKNFFYIIISWLALFVTLASMWFIFIFRHGVGF